MGEEIAFESGRISDFQGLATLTLTLDRVTLHTVMHHSSTSTYTPNLIETFCGRTDGRTYGRTFETDCIRSTWRSRPNNMQPLTRRVSVMKIRIIAGGQSSGNLHVWITVTLEKKSSVCFNHSLIIRAVSFRLRAMPISCTISLYRRDTGRQWQILPTSPIFCVPQGCPHRNFTNIFGVEKNY